VIDTASSGQGQTVYMQNSQPSGAKGFAVLVGIMVAIVLVLMAIAVLLSPHH
jgi:flagellar basal body-associated protein FliL